ncbi:MAG: hypothetical protein OEY93_07520 [Anaerolineae bacterium]|nr:hypothetical protein [Anaerolineae bacterium]
MLNSSGFNWDLFKRGGKVGVRYAIWGSFGFAISEGFFLIVISSSNRNIGEILEYSSSGFVWTFFLIIFGIMLSIIPGYLGGGLLAHFFRKDLIREKYRGNLGMVLGVFAGAVTCFPALMLLTMLFKAKSGIFDISKIISEQYPRVYLVTVIATIAGGLGGRRLARELGADGNLNAAE